MNALALLSHTVLSIAGPRFLLGIKERATTLSGGGARLFFVGMFDSRTIPLQCEFHTYGVNSITILTTHHHVHTAQPTGL